MRRKNKVEDGATTITDSRKHECVRTRWSRTSSEEASVIEACSIGEGVATDNDVRMEVAMDTTSDGAGNLPTPVLETHIAGPRASVRTRVTDGGDDKAGNRNEEEVKASVTEADPIEDGVAADNDVRKEVVTDTTSGGAGTLPTPILEIRRSPTRAT